MGKENLPSLKIGQYEIKYPIIVGGMSIRGTGKDIVVATSQCGGLGVIGGVGRGLGRPEYQHLNPKEADRQALKDEILQAWKMDPHGIHAVNILAAVTDYDHLVRVAVENGVNIIISGAGLPVDLPALTADHPEVALVPMVSSLRVADFFCRQWMRKHGRLPDAIIVEEPATAGGHLGASTRQEVEDPKLKLNVVVPQILSYLEEKKYDISIIVAGGIWDKTDIEKWIALGASGAQMATRFVCTHECEFPPEFKQKYLHATTTVLTKSPVGIMGRVVETEFSRRVARGEDVGHKCRVSCLKRCTLRDGGEGYCIMEALVTARRGDVENGIVFAGTNAPRSRQQGIVSVRQIFNELTNS
ncbi:nitronate monooxygenase family protein [Patescibacteria group bacterium]|nr:nitronate monooxygenase family protein [Patescibacteria group bacterium]